MISALSIVAFVVAAFRAATARLEVQLGDGSTVAYDCSGDSVVECTRSFCELNQISDECVWQIINATARDDVDALLEVALSDLRSAYTSIEESRIVVSRLLERVRDVKSTMGGPAANVAQPHWKLAFSGADGDQVAEVVRDWGEIYALSLQHVVGDPARRRGKLSVAFVSSWFCNSAIGRLCGGLVEHLDRSQFSVTVCHVRDGKGAVRRDFYTEDIERWADWALELPFELDSARKTLFDAAFDIIVYTDIGMEPFSYALSFSRLASVQLAFWGHPTSSGVPDSIDYYLLMDAAEPDLNATNRYSEQLVRLDTLGAFFRTNESGQFQPDRTRYSYASAHPILGQVDPRMRIYACPQHCLKYHPEFDVVLMGILEADPDAVVVVRNCSGRVSPDVVARLGQHDRIIQVPTLSLYDYVGLFGAAHVALEPFPFGGSITTMDAFEAGTPIVARTSHQSKRPALSVSLYNILGAHDCCLGHDAESYVQKAINIASHGNVRAAIQSHLYDRHGLLFENADAVNEFENFLQRAAKLASPTT